MGWINVKESRPEFFRPVLAFDTQRIYIAFRPKEDEYNEHWIVCDDSDCGCNGCTGAITHWMPLPNDPNEIL